MGKAAESAQGVGRVRGHLLVSIRVEINAIDSRDGRQSRKDIRRPHLGCWGSVVTT